MLKYKETHVNTIDGKIKPTKYNILATDLEFGEQVTKNGIIIVNDDMKERGIRARWCKVHAVGNKISDLTSGQWILVDHARWSVGFSVDEGAGPFTLRWVDYKDVLLVTDEKPFSYNSI